MGAILLCIGEEFVAVTLRGECKKAVAWSKRPRVVPKTADFDREVAVKKCVGELSKDSRFHYR
jgi:hypothetical protein